MISILSVSLVILATIIGAFGSLFFKKSSKNLTINIKLLIKNRLIYIGFMFFIVSAVFYIIALKEGDVSTIYPFVSLSYIWVSLLSVKFLNENMTKLKWFGIAIIVLGVIFIGISG